jgi:aminoglycoside phosphotransferase (APT) family kinase protein
MEFRKRLEAHPWFADLDRWQVVPIRIGLTSPHTYRFRLREQDYFVKEIKPNEARALRLLTHFDLRIAPRVVFPELLGDHILVTEYVDGGPIASKQLPRGFIQRYADMQNVLNTRDALLGTEAFEGCAFATEDDGFYRRGILRCLDQGYGNLLSLRRHDLPVVQAYIEIANRIRAHREAVAAAFSRMPFAWLHHDFREAHILGDPSILVDWGSSYGHGPFLFDLGPFLMGDPAGLDTFIARSELCREAARATIERWLYAATCAAFAGFMLWRLGDFGYVDGRQGRDACRALLEYEYPAFAPLLSGPIP